MAANKSNIPLGTRALILSKYYYGVLADWLRELDIDRYYAILLYVSENDGCSQQQICNNLAIDKSAMVKVMDYLIEKGSVKREVNPDDRREHFIRLTAKGKQQAGEVAKAFERLDRKMLSDLPVADRRRFVDALDLVINTLKKLPGESLFFNYRRTKATKRKETT